MLFCKQLIILTVPVQGSSAATLCCFMRFVYLLVKQRALFERKKQFLGFLFYQAVQKHYVRWKDKAELTFSVTCLPKLIKTDHATRMMTILYVKVIASHTVNFFDTQCRCACVYGGKHTVPFTGRH